MEIIVDKNQILNKFLIPLSKFTDQAIVNLYNDSIDCLAYTTNDKQSIVLYTKLFVKTDMPPETSKIQLNVGNLKKLIHALTCLNDVTIMKLNIEKNNISYTSSETNFKFHLKEDGVISQTPVNVEKVLSLNFATIFTLSNSKIDEILKASNFSAESNKIYLFSKNNMLFAELTDKTIPNLDTMNVFLTNEIQGNQLVNPIPLRLDIFKIISTLKFNSLTIKINEKGVVVFEIVEDNYLMKYITSCLVK